MRKIDLERAKNYIARHERYKKWLAIILVLAMLAGIGTFYALNKPATAVSEETADEIGMTYNEGNDDEGEDEEIEDSGDEDSDGDEDSGENENDGDEDEGNEDGGGEEDSGENEESAEEAEPEESVEGNSETENAEETDNSNDGESETESGTEEAAAENTEISAETSGVSENSAEENSDENDSVSEDSAEAVSDNSAEEEEEAVSDNSVEDETVSDNSVSDNSVSENSVSANRTEYKYSDSKISITATIKEASAIPDDAELQVTELTADTEGYNYDAYMEALNEKAEEIAEEAGQEESLRHTENNTLMYDIAFISEGQEIQPKEGAVSISVEFKKNQLSEELSVENKEDLVVVHLPIKEEVKETEEITTTQDATAISSNDIEVRTLTEATAEVEETEKIEFSEESFSIYAITVYHSHEAGTDNYETVLGDAINFGITANTFSLYGDSQTNFAAQLVANAQSQTGNNLTNEAEQTFMIGSIASGYTLNYRGGSYPAYFLIPEEYSGQLNNSGNDRTYFKVDTSYSSDEIKSDVSDMITYAKAASTELASRSQTVYLEKVDPNNSDTKYKVDIRDRVDGTYYVNMTADDMDHIAKAEWLQIYKNDGQTIVFNVDSDRTINLFKYGVNGTYTDGMINSNEYSSVAQTIIWNFTKSTTINACGSIVGTFIAPTSAWYNYGTSAGWLVASTVYISSGEWHNIYTGIRQISGTATIEAYKNIDGAYATASGFKFTLYEKSSDSWEEVETVENDAHDISFSTITYNDKNTSLSNVGDSQEFIYKIAETAGINDSNGNAYIADTTVYYAKVTVTLKNNGKNYYIASEPVYYTDESCANKYTDENRPVFNNSSGNGSVTLGLYKYLNGGDPGDHKFQFTVRVLKNEGSLETLTDSLENDGKSISFTTNIKSEYIYNNNVYFVITENSVSDANVERDESYIIVKVDNPTGTEHGIRYYRQGSEIDTRKDGSEKLNYFKWIGNGANNSSNGIIRDANDVAFYNTGKGNLRIHKMVVNDYGTKMVRNATGTALLSNVVFRVTNNDTGNYIVFTGYTTSTETVEGWAVEYEAEADSDGKHNTTGNSYDVAYNHNAQWTLIGIPAGTYTVDEVGDGYTFEYHPEENVSRAIDDARFCRVTKYDLTVDTEGAPNVNEQHGVGGDNYRKVFSVDLKNHNNTGPDNVKVGDSSVDNDSHTQTVQVCNYYSIPIGPIVINKNFNSDSWDSDLEFSFRIEAVSYSAHDSAGNDVSLDSQPMPEKEIATVSAVDAEKSGGVWNALASFGAVSFRYEGTYIYKISETDDGKNGISYDSRTYYLQIVVSKKYTKFEKEYSYEKMTNPEKYTSDTKLDEDFYYLGADISYSEKNDFNDNNIIAKESLYLGDNPDTSANYNNKFIEDWDEDYSDGAPAFENTRTASLSVNKIWLDNQGQDESESHTAVLNVLIMRKTDSSEWDNVVQTSLDRENGWTVTVNDLPIYDVSGNKYIYCVKEEDLYSKTYSVTYSYNGEDYSADYEMTFDSEQNSFGSVTITNRKITSYVLPSTGGRGTLPYKVAGAAVMLIAIAFICKRVRRRKL